MDAELLTLVKPLKSFGLLASMPYNLADRGSWSYSFVSGLDGCYYRLLSLKAHRNLLFEWNLHSRRMMDEPNAAIMLFCMDSALECLIFALNALGYAYAPDEFLDVTNDRALRGVSPRDALSRSGWTQIYPTFRQHLQASSELMRIVIENHDVTKHRQQGFHGGMHRQDPPAGFYEQLGLSAADAATLDAAPWLEILIPKNPKLPFEQRPTDLASWTNLDTLNTDFLVFMKESIRRAVADVELSIRLSVPGFREREFVTLYGRPLAK